MNSGTTTADATIPSPAAAAAEIQARVVGLKIPVRDHPNGPVTRARLRRTFSVIACGWALGLVLLLASGRVALEAFGLGLLLPGGGFAYTADPALAAALFAFGLALVIYWAFGPVLLPPAVWIGTAALSVLRVDEEQLAPPKHVAHPPQRDQQRREDQRVDRVRPLGIATFTIVASTMIIETPRAMNGIAYQRRRSGVMVVGSGIGVGMLITAATMPFFAHEPDL